MTQLLITGCESGLGKYLCQHFTDADKLTRQNCSEILTSQRTYEYVIHCAFNRGYTKDPQKCLSEDTNLTKALCHIANSKVIFMSSIEVHTDEDTVYIESKKKCEEILSDASKKNLSVRLCAMLGDDIKSNSAQKILKGDIKDLTLDLDSSFYYCTHSQALEFIQLCISEDICGTIDFVPSEKVTLREVMNEFGESPVEPYKYVSPDIENSQIQKYMPKFAKQTSLSIIREFAKENNR
jgi:hypothetical protein